MLSSRLLYFFKMRIDSFLFLLKFIRLIFSQALIRPIPTPSLGVLDGLLHRGRGLRVSDLRHAGLSHAQPTKNSSPRQSL